MGFSKSFLAGVALVAATPLAIITVQPQADAAPAATEQAAPIEDGSGFRLRGTRDPRPPHPGDPGSEQPMPENPNFPMPGWPTPEMPAPEEPINQPPESPAPEIPVEEPIEEAPQLPSPVVPIETPINEPVPEEPVQEEPEAPSGEEGKAQQAILQMTNQERAKAGCGPLSLNGQLNQAADAHSRDMIDRDFFDHTNPDGESPGDRISQTGYRAYTWGENIAYGYSSAEDVMNGWMNSSGHRANILNCDFEELGVGYEVKNGNTIYWTQVFGTR